jgi:hypothetical protein
MRAELVELRRSLGSTGLRLARKCTRGSAPRMASAVFMAYAGTMRQYPLWAYALSFAFSLFWMGFCILAVPMWWTESVHGPESLKSFNSPLFAYAAGFGLYAMLPLAVCFLPPASPRTAATFAILLSAALFVAAMVFRYR